MNYHTNGLISRDVHPSTPYVILVADEWVQLIRHTAEYFQRGLSLFRSKRGAVWLINQTIQQISPPSLLASVIGNVSAHVAFRPDPADVSHLLPLLPTTGRIVDPKYPDRLLSPAAEREWLLGRLQQLGKRRALFGNLAERNASFLTTLNVPFDQAERRARSLRASELEQFRRGAIGTPFNQIGLCQNSSLASTLVPQIRPIVDESRPSAEVSSGLVAPNKERPRKGGKKLLLP